MPITKLLWCGFAYLCIGLGVAGIVLPLLPTTPLLLLAFWAATRGSPRLAHWLYNHPQFHPYLDAWQTHRAIPKKAKWLALVLLSASWLTLFMMDAHPFLLAGLWLLFSAVVAFIFTRPTVNT